jgi:hypothetical protein
MYNKNIVLLLLFTLSSSYSQIGGQSVYQFLNIISSPRQAALGGKVIGTYDYDVNQPLFNPASINDEMNGKLAVNYGNYFGDVQYGTASYAYTHSRFRTFHAGVNYINYGKFDGRDEFGEETGKFSGSETALSLGHSYNFSGINWHLGANLKFIFSSLEIYNSFGIASDVGLLHVNDYKTISYGLSIRNIGTQLSSYNGTKEKLPLEVLFGFSQELENVPIRWHLTLENLQQWEVSFSNPGRVQQTIEGEEIKEKVSVLNNAFRHVIFGAELFPKKVFTARFSYNFRRSAELKILEQRTFSGLSLGFGIRFTKFRFDYSYSRYTLASNTSLFGLTINL